MDEERYRLSPEYILYLIVTEWELNENWNHKIYNAAFEELMKMLVDAGYVGKDETAK